MRFSRYIQLTTILFLLISSISFAGSKEGRIRYTTGDATKTRNGETKLINGDKTKEEFKNLKKAGKDVKQGDFIRTYMESLVIVALPDGSSFSVQENTDLFIETMNFENGDNSFVTKINNGKMGFDVQKQKTAGKFKFSTGTATAAIRGTNGIFGKTANGKLVGSLKNGKLDIEYNKQNYSINGGQTALEIGNQLAIFDLKSSGDSKFLRKIDSLSTDSIAPDSLSNRLKDMDESFQSKMEELKKSINCSVPPLPDTLYSNKVNLSVECSQGAMVSILDTAVLSDGTPINLPFSWESSSTGPKKINILCYFDKTSYFNCGEAHTYYAGIIDTTQRAVVQAPLTITTASPLEICNPASATIEGTFDSRDTNATLFIKLGNYTSPNLAQISVNGKFSHTIPVSDAEGNWNETKATVTYSSTIYGTKTATMNLMANKTCKEVNTIAPKVSFENYDSLKCIMNVAFLNINDDMAIYSVAQDNAAGMDTYLKKNTPARINLQKGIHEYQVKVTDQAGRSSRINKRLGCYPVMNAINISFKGGNVEDLLVPPPPNGIKNSFFKVLQFSVQKLPGNNPDFIKEVVISQPGQDLITLRGSDITDTRFSQQIELVRNQNQKSITRIDVTVTLKSGQIFKASKTYMVH